MSKEKKNKRTEKENKRIVVTNIQAKIALLCNTFSKRESIFIEL